MTYNPDDNWDDTPRVSGGDVHDLEAEGPLVGVYLGYKEVPTKFGPAKLHAFKTEKGVEKVWGKTDIDNKLNGREEEYVRVAMTDERIDTGAGNPMVVFDVRSKGRPSTDPF